VSTTIVGVGSGSLVRVIVVVKLENVMQVLAGLRRDARHAGLDDGDDLGGDPRRLSVEDVSNQRVDLRLEVRGESARDASLLVKEHEGVEKVSKRVELRFDAMHDALTRATLGELHRDTVPSLPAPGAIDAKGSAGDDIAALTTPAEVQS
jgi:hypothetical protein